MPNEEEDVVREYKAMHEEDFCSRRREDDKVKKKEKLKLREKEKKRRERGKERRKKKRTKRRRLKEDVRVWFLRKPLNFLSREGFGELRRCFLGTPCGGA